MFRFGFLLPFYLEKFKKSYFTILIGFCVTLLIEILQYITKIGIFEIDDIFNNTLGLIIGYFTFLICKSLYIKQNRKMIFIYILPALITICAFLGIYIKYKNQEVGNLKFGYTYKINMRNVKVENRIEFSNNIDKKDIYYTKILSQMETKEIAEKIFENLDVEIEESRTDIYEDEAIYYSKQQHSIWVKYNGGTYKFNAPVWEKKEQSLDNKNEFYENNGVAIKYQENNNVKGASEETIRNALKKLGIIIPKNAKFEETSEGEYIFSIDMNVQDNSLIDGTIKCSYYNGEVIRNLKNDLLKYEKVNEKEIISEQEAYQEILEGKFLYDNYKNEKLESIIIKDVNIQYTLDTKGYYVPVYVFDVEMNNEENSIEIKALKEES